MYKKVLTIQDISCVGQCSLTVALPIISACGHETCILPTAILSTHTTGFTGYTCRDLSKDIPDIISHWEREKIKFDSIYTGYLGSNEEIKHAIDIIDSMGKDNLITIVDPAMADNGKLYPAFNMEYVKEMVSLAKKADILLPNITEACLLTGYPYKEKYDEEYIDGLLKALKALGIKKIVLTGVSFTDDTIGVTIYEGAHKEYYSHRKIGYSFHGTGDVFASTFVGALMNDKRIVDAARIAAEFTLSCIEYTYPDKNHNYGVKFEPLLSNLINVCK